MDFLNFNPNSIIQFLIDPPGAINVIRALFILTFLFFVAGIMYFLKNSHYLQFAYGEDFSEFMASQPYGTKKVSKLWSNIQTRLKSGLESDYKLAVIEAEGILEDTLKLIGYSGATMDDKLKKLTPEHLSNLDDVMRAHRVRDNIIRDPDYNLTLSEAKKTIEIYEKALKELEVF